MPEGESPHRPEEFDPEKASPSLKRTAETAADEGKLAAAGRQHGLTESHEETLEESAARAEAQLEGTPTKESIAQEEQKRMDIVKKNIQPQKQEGVVIANNVEQIVSQHAVEHEDEQAGAAFPSFRAAARTLAAEPRTLETEQWIPIELDPVLKNLEKQAADRLKLAGWHIDNLRHQPHLSPEVEHRLVIAQDYLDTVVSTLNRRRTVFFEGYRLGHLGQAHKAALEAKIDLMSMTGELAKLNEALGKMHGGSKRP